MCGVGPVLLSATGRFPDMFSHASANVQVEQDGLPKTVEDADCTSAKRDRMQSTDGGSRRKRLDDLYK